jgi:hypothetical protein
MQERECILALHPARHNASFESEWIGNTGRSTAVHYE